MTEAEARHVVTQARKRFDGVITLEAKRGYATTTLTPVGGEPVAIRIMLGDVEGSTPEHFQELIDWQIEAFDASFSTP